MGIIDFLKKKKEVSGEDSNVIDLDVRPSATVDNQKEQFVSNLSLVDLQGVDWRKFAGMLKKEGVLSNSYDKTPVSIDYSLTSDYTLTKDNSIMVELTFKSTTSDSVRKVKLFKDKACLIVNGAIEMFPETQRNKDLNALWQSFYHNLKASSEIRMMCSGLEHSRRGAVLRAQAKKMLEMEDICERENEFLEKYQDTTFDGFDYSFSVGVGDMPRFVPLEKTKDGKIVSGIPVIPFTPRTLEHCILNMSYGQRIEDGEYMDDFEEKCRKIQKYSCFESKDWDKVINFGKDIVERAYQASIMDDEIEMN